MRRRRLLTALVAGTGGYLSGCLGSRAPRVGSDASTTPVTADVSLPVSRSAMRQPLPKDHIPAIIDPAFASDWSTLDAPDGIERPLLPEGAPVIGVERAGEARAYPLRILDWHEVVNDRLGGPLLVTYCVLCGSAVVAERLVAGRETVFGVTGRLWRSDLVLYDRATESDWSQLLARAIRGPRTGERLALRPARVTTWGEWRRGHPAGEVLLPPPRSSTVEGRETFPYFEPKYGYGEERSLRGYDGDGSHELRGKTLVLGVVHDGVAKAYPFPRVREAGVVNDAVNGLPIAVTVTRAGTLAAWVRRIDGARERFESAGERFLRADGSRWERATGRAVDGPHEGKTLDPANDLPALFWRGWSAFNPETAVYRG